MTELSIQEHARWMRDHNPDGWHVEDWVAFSVRMAGDDGFRARVDEARGKRHDWAAAHVTNLILGRRVAAGLVRDLRLDANREAERIFPRPSPWENDWQMPEKVDPVSAVGRPRRPAFRTHYAPQALNDSNGLAAAREASQRLGGGR